jgi:hypothetical protein
MVYQGLDGVVLKLVTTWYLVAALMGLCIGVPVVMLMRVFHVPGWVIFDAVEGVLRFFFR